MKYIYKMESLLISVTVILCAVLLTKLLFKLRSVLPWRVNCWFCNNYFWIKYPDRNSWTCRKCEQYNGFTKDGDYNKPITVFNGQVNTTPKVFKNSPPKNGLCKMCNINQQLKVAQLANFVPMNEKKFDEEIESYRLQLEKAYKLCSPCRKVVQLKLYKEKETLLGSKLLQARSPEKMDKKCNKQRELLKKFVNNTSMLAAIILFIFVSFEFYTKLTLRYKNLHSTVIDINEIAIGLLERIYSIIIMKTTMTFPSLKGFYDIFDMKMMPKNFNFRDVHVEQVNLTIQKALGSFVCFLQTIGLIWNVNSLKNTIIINMQWVVFVVATLGNNYMALEPMYLSLVKMMCAFIVIVVYKSVKAGGAKRIPIKILASPKNINNLMKSSEKSLIDNDEDDTIQLDTDDDVSLSKFGVHNFSESSNETISPLNTSVFKGRTFTPRPDSLWTKPKLNSTFCINPVKCETPTSISDSIFVKPSFNKYQKLAKDDSDSELDESISSLCIGSPSKKKKSNPVFSLRKFTATPSFVAPTPLTRSRPLISPSKLSTSWVAGGYWGSDGERQMFSIDGSRSSSQSSGFESQTSSMNHRNLFSQPSSREDSVCGEPMVLDSFPPKNNFNGFQSPPSFCKATSPIFPQMQYNNHVHIPQTHFVHPTPTLGSQNLFSQQQTYHANNIFKTPTCSGLIKLPQINTSTSH